MARWCRRISNLLLASFFMLAWFAPVGANGLPEQITISTEQPAVDVPIALYEPGLLHVQFGSRLSCDEFSAQYPNALDAYLFLLDSAGAVIAADDDGDHDPISNCLGSKLHIDLPAGDYIVRFTRYGQTAGVGFVSWASEPNTTTTTTISTTTSVDSTAPSTAVDTTVPDTTTSTTTISTSSTSTTSTTTTTVSTMPTPVTSSSSSTTSSTTTVAPTTSTTTTTAPTTTASTTSTTELPVATISTTSAPSISLPTVVSLPSTTTTMTPSTSTSLPPTTSTTSSSTTTSTLPVDTSTSTTSSSSTTEPPTSTSPPAPPPDAPTEVREAFEAAVDIYSGEYDEYVPIGSTVTVAQRRVIIATTAITVIAPVSSSSGRGRKRT